MKKSRTHGENNNDFLKTMQNNLFFQKPNSIQFSWEKKKIQKMNAKHNEIVRIVKIFQMFSFFISKSLILKTNRKA